MSTADVEGLLEVQRAFIEINQGEVDGRLGGFHCDRWEVYRARAERRAAGGLSLKPPTSVDWLRRDAGGRGRPLASDRETLI